MPRIHPVNSKNVQPASEQLLSAIEKKLGKAPNIFKTFAHSPAVLGAYLGWAEAMKTSSLSDAVREQIALAVGQQNNCNYCLAAHTAIGKGAGLSEEQLLQSREGKDNDPKVDALLKFSEAIVSKRGFVSDDDLHAVKDAGANETEIVETVAAVAQNIFTNYFNHVAETEVDFEPAPELSTN